MNPNWKRKIKKACISILHCFYQTHYTNTEKPLSFVQYPAWVVVAGTFIQTSFETYGLLLCYLVMVLVSVFTQLTLISLVYMAMVFFCLVIHYQTPRAQVHIRRIWLIIVLLEGAILVARYLYQFDGVRNWLQSNYPPDACILLHFGY
jgi:hypothetical protein